MIFLENISMYVCKKSGIFREKDILNTNFTHGIKKNCRLYYAIDPTTIKISSRFYQKMYFFIVLLNFCVKS